MTQQGRCEWCRRGIAYGGGGRPRKYCRRSHRQRAYEARLLASRMGLAEGLAVVSERDLGRINDGIYVIESALDDVERDVSRDPGDLAAAFEHLYVAATGLRGATLEPRALRDG